jgi:two-component system cell cycle response regulator DivK
MSKNVLVIDDDNMSGKLVADVLLAHGYLTLRARDGRTGIAVARGHRPCLIVMDVSLPDISGLDVVKALKADPDLWSIPVIAVTSRATGGDRDAILAGGFDGHLAKPISITRFIQTVGLALSEIGDDIGLVRQAIQSTAPEITAW